MHKQTKTQKTLFTGNNFFSSGINYLNDLHNAVIVTIRSKEASVYSCLSHSNGQNVRLKNMHKEKAKLDFNCRRGWHVMLDSSKSMEA